MKRRDFIKRTGQTLLITSVASIVGVSCSSSDDTNDDNGMFDDGYYDDGYYDDGYYDGGY